MVSLLKQDEKLLLFERKKNLGPVDTVGEHDTMQLSVFNSLAIQSGGVTCREGMDTDKIRDEGEAPLAVDEATRLG